MEGYGEVVDVIEDFAAEVTLSTDGSRRTHVGTPTARMVDYRPFFTSLPMVSAAFADVWLAMPPMSLTPMLIML